MSRAAVYAIDEFKTAQRSRTYKSIRCYCDAPQIGQEFVLSEVREFRASMGTDSVLKVNARDAKLLGDPGGNSRKWDMIYSTELLSGLCTPAAGKAVEELFSRLNPGGRLLLSNISPNPEVQACGICSHPDIHFRNGLDIAELTRGIPERVLAGQAVFSDGSGLNVYLELHKSLSKSMLRK